jgi:2-polyprenyl-3-methyl-5-hydroxy-6-metoxy-1,4-benzoquinol methylase
LIRTIDDALLAEMQSRLSAEDAAEMAIPSYRHKNPLLRTMAWWRVYELGKLLERTMLRDGAGRRGVLRLMDFGCGCGVLLEQESRDAKHVHGVDIVLGAAEFLVQRKALRNVTLLRPEQMSTIEAGTVDLIVAGEVLEHIEPLDDTLREFERLLAKGGSLLVSLPTENQLYRLGRRIAGFSGHYHHSDARRIDRQIRDSGFKARWSRSIPLPGPLAIYWVVQYERP